MDRKYAHARSHFFLFAACLAALLAAVTHHYVFAGLFAGAATLIAFTTLVRAFRAASHVVDGADRMLDELQQARSNQPAAPATTKSPDPS